MVKIKNKSDGLRDAGKIKVGWLVSDESGPGASKKPFSVVTKIDKRADGTVSLFLADGRTVEPLGERDLVWSALPAD